MSEKWFLRLSRSKARSDVEKLRTLRISNKFDKQAALYIYLFKKRDCIIFCDNNS